MDSRAVLTATLPTNIFVGILGTNYKHFTYALKHNTSSWHYLQLQCWSSNKWGCIISYWDIKLWSTYRIPHFQLNVTGIYHYHWRHAQWRTVNQKINSHTAWLLVTESMLNNMLHFWGRAEAHPLLTTFTSNKQIYSTTINGTINIPPLICICRKAATDILVIDLLHHSHMLISY